MIPMLNVARQTTAIRGQIDAAVARVLDHGRFILGPEVQQLEEKVAALCGARYGVSCASGTDALLLCLMALGVGPGDRVVTTPFTFFASAGSISRLGAKTVFVDIDPETFNLDPSKLAAKLDSMASDQLSTVKAIMPVHLFGQCAQMDAIMQVADRYEIPVVEDAAQAIGATFSGRPAGSMGKCNAFSFFPSKNLGGAGDGGLITTDDPDLAKELRRIRVHGTDGQYYHRTVGINSRMDTLQAAILLVKLDYLGSWTERRAANAAYYKTRLAGLGDTVVVPCSDPSARHVFNQFTLRLRNRDQVRAGLAQAGVASAIYYPLPLHLQECFIDLGYQEGDFPESEAAAKEVLSIPIDPELTQGERENVAAALVELL